MLKEKSKPDYKLLFIFPWLHPPSSPGRLSTLTVNLKISHLYKLSPLYLYVREREMHASSRACTQYQCNQIRQNMFKLHQTASEEDLLLSSKKGDYSDWFAMISKIHTSISCLPYKCTRVDPLLTFQSGGWWKTCRPGGGGWCPAPSRASSCPWASQPSPVGQTSPGSTCKNTHQIEGVQTDTVVHILDINFYFTCCKILCDNLDITNIIYR